MRKAEIVRRIAEATNLTQVQAEDVVDAIFDASRRTVERIALRLENLPEGTHVLDIGSGYGGAARFLARSYGCLVSALNLSDVENETARRLNEEQGLDHRLSWGIACPVTHQRLLL